MTYTDLIDAIDERWLLIVQDLADLGIDVWDKPLMRSRPWTWLRTHIEGLITRPVTHDMNGAPVWPNRLMRALNPQPDPPAAVNQ